MQVVVMLPFIVATMVSGVPTTQAIWPLPTLALALAMVPTLATWPTPPKPRPAMKWMEVDQAGRARPSENQVQLDCFTFNNEQENSWCSENSISLAEGCELS